jgi:hypothetical protein
LSKSIRAVTLSILAVVATDAIGAPPAFPVRHGGSHRFLVDRSGRPFPILGRTAWFLTSLPAADAQTFIDDTAARGYTAIEFHVINHDPRGNHPPFNGTGDAPFLNTLDGGAWDGSLAGGAAPDFTTPNPAYWSSVDALLAYAESKGLLVLMFPAYVGFDGGQQGWMGEMVANGPANMFTYGAWIADRYKRRANVVWMAGGDLGVYTAERQDAEAALLDGMKSVLGQQSVQFSAEWDSGMIATDQESFGHLMTLNSVYSWSGQVTSLGRRAYAHAPTRPAFLLEEPYDEEGPDGNGYNPNATQPVRRFQWSGWLSTIGGYVSGNGYVWPFNPGWESHLDTQGSQDMARLNDFIRSIAWSQLVPSGLGGMRTLITEGAGTEGGSDEVVAAASTNGKLLVAYVPPDHVGSITVDMGALHGASRARWFDPTSGTYVLAETSLLPGPVVFAPPGPNSAGENDWVLVIDELARRSGPPPFPRRVGVR